MATEPSDPKAAEDGEPVSRYIRSMFMVCIAAQDYLNGTIGDNDQEWHRLSDAVASWEVERAR